MLSKLEFHIPIIIYRDPSVVVPDTDMLGLTMLILAIVDVLLEIAKGCGHAPAIVPAHPVAIVPTEGNLGRRVLVAATLVQSVV